MKRFVWCCPRVSHALLAVAASAIVGGAVQAETRLNATDGAQLVHVPPGPFLMGNDEGDPSEKPARTVSLSQGFWISRTEVTAGQYLAFANATGREVKTPPKWSDQHPITYVSWADADAYCTWAGGQLPTEAQWEKAARGEDGRLWPWGNAYDRSFAHVGPGVKPEPKPVGSYPQGASPYGALDMTGNVSEWVKDHYGSSYFAGAPTTDPTGPDRGTRGVRGGSFRVGNPKKLTTTTRAGKSETTRGADTGFRCAFSG